MLDKILKMIQAKERENYVEKRPEDVYRGIAERTDLSKEDAASIGGVESQHGKYNTSKRSSAKGIMQIMPKLAESMKPGSSKNLEDRNVQQDVASDVLNMNDPSIKEIRDGKANIVDQYLMYNLGEGAGKRFLSADENSSVQDVLPSKVIKANPKLYKHATVGEARKAIKGILEAGKTSAEFYPDPQDIFKKKEEE